MIQKSIIATLISLVSAILFVSFCSCTPTPSNQQTTADQTNLLKGYDLSRPDVFVTLPSVLHEISGLTEVDDNTLACVQDELGIVFIYSVTDKKIVRKINFGGDGDYEGITRVDDHLYVMRSDGKMYEVSNYKSDNFEVKEYQVKLPTKDNEGLAYDPKNERLLLAGKSGAKEAEYKNSRLVYSFDLKTKSISTKPAFVFNKDQMSITMSSLSNTQGKKRKKNKNVPFNPSAIAVHPTTGNLYVISAKGSMLYVFDRNSNLVSYTHLDGKEFLQPEGITFMDNGDMLISNEGKKDRPNVLKFKYKGA